MEKYDITRPVILKKGVYKLNDEANFNYQLNRVINWDGGRKEVSAIYEEERAVNGNKFK